MKKRLFSACLALTLAAASAAVVPSAVTAMDLTDNSSADSIHGKVYTFFYEDIDTAEIDRVVMEKRDEYVHSLYETMTDQNEIDRADVDFTHSLRLEMLKAAYGEKSEAILGELGVDPDKAFCSMFTPMIVCELTDSQLEKAGNMEVIREISPYVSINMEDLADKDRMTYTNKEEFLQLFFEENDGGYCFDGNIRVDAQLDCAVGTTDGGGDLIDYLIFYGLPNENAIRTVVNQMMLSDVKLVNPIDDYCGCEYRVSMDTMIQSPNEIRAVFFIEDEYPGWTKESPVSFSERVGFDAAPYIICKGDVNGDYNIDAADASEILKMYARLMTENLAISNDEFKHYDVNSDVAIDADDASAVLAYYSFISTGGDASVSLKKFLNKE